MNPWPLRYRYNALPTELACWLAAVYNKIQLRILTYQDYIQHLMVDGYCVIVCHSEVLCRYHNVIAGDFQRLYKSPTNLPNNAKQIHSSWILVYSSPAMKILLQIRRKRLKILALKLLGQLKNEIVRTGSKLAQPTFCIRFTVSTVICFRSRTGSVISSGFETQRNLTFSVEFCDVFALNTTTKFALVPLLQLK